MAHTRCPNCKCDSKSHLVVLVPAQPAQGRRDVDVRGRQEAGPVKRSHEPIRVEAEHDLRVEAVTQRRVLR